MGNGKGAAAREGGRVRVVVIPTRFLTTWWVTEENVVFHAHKCHDFYFLNIFKSPESQADFAHTSILRTEHPHPKWDLLPTLLNGRGRHQWHLKSGGNATRQPGVARAGQDEWGGNDGGTTAAWTMLFWRSSLRIWQHHMTSLVQNHLNFLKRT